jgi:hypothetical protein
MANLVPFVSECRFPLNNPNHVACTIGIAVLRQGRTVRPIGIHASDHTEAVLVAHVDSYIGFPAQISCCRSHPKLRLKLNSHLSHSQKG